VDAGDVKADIELVDSRGVRHAGNGEDVGGGQ
jgi:hypothetical protein